MGLVGKIALLLLLGVQLGELVASWIAPGVLTWYATPGAGVALCDCATLSRDTVSRLLRAQLVGAVIGATVAVGLGIFVMRLRKKSHEPAHADSPPPPPPPKG